MRRIHACLALLLAAPAVSACEASTPPPASTPRPGPAAGTSNKHALYADAGLIPSREGELVRRELAYAGEILSGLELLGLGRAHVDVELRGAEPSAVIVAQVDPVTTTAADLGELDASVVELAVASVPDLQAPQVHVWLQPRATPIEPAPRRPSWTLALTCLGLGLSLGVTLERLRCARNLAMKYRS